MTSTPPVGEPEQQWQQPAFVPREGADDVVSGEIVPTGPSSAVAPRTVSSPPSVAESVVGTLAGLVWPIMIVTAIMGGLGWWPAIIIALVASAVLGNVRQQLKWRRKAITKGDTPDESTPEELR